MDLWGQSGCLPDRIITEESNDNIKSGQLRNCWVWGEIFKGTILTINLNKVVEVSTVVNKWSQKFEVAKMVWYNILWTKIKLKEYLTNLLLSFVFFQIYYKRQKFLKRKKKIDE